MNNVGVWDSPVGGGSFNEKNSIEQDWGLLNQDDTWVISNGFTGV